MKKTLLLIAVALFLSGAAYSQFALGLKLGYNANKLSTNIDTVKTQFNSGFHVGVWTHIGKRLYFAPELNYTMSGAIFQDDGAASLKGWKQKINIGSVNVPLLLGFKIMHSGLITWRIELGPEVSFVVNKKIKDETSIIGPIEDADIKNTNWYIMGGTGIDVLFLAFDIRYKYSLNNIIAEVENSSFDAHNGMFLVSVGFKIFGKK